jgi:transcriptional regulator with XRE-family HTH domain
MLLAARLRELRLKRNESLQDVSNAIGVSKTHIWELEKNRSKNPSLELLNKLADHFGVTINSLFNEDPGAIENDESLVRMFRQVGALDENERAVLDDMIQAFLKRKKQRDASD